MVAGGEGGTEERKRKAMRLHLFRLLALLALKYGSAEAGLGCYAHAGVYYLYDDEKCWV